MYYYAIKNIGHHARSKVIKQAFISLYINNQVNARALIGQSAMVYCAGKLMEKSRIF